jgi:hypothetical protein
MTRRTFTVLDALILIAVTAMGLVWWRILAQYGLVPDSLGSHFLEASLRERLRSGLLIAVFEIYPLMVAWTFGLLLLRLRNPRPRLVRMARQPSFVAECAVLMALAVTVGELAGWRVAGCGLGKFAVLALRGQAFREMLDNGLSFDETIKQIAAAVGSVWGVMFLGRALRPEKSWIDRLGRVVGVLWMVMYLIRITTMQSD